MRDQLISAPKTAPAMRPSLGDRVRQLRIAAGLTQTELAGERFSKEYVSQIERGKTRPTPATVEWLARRLGVDASFLATGIASDDRARVDAVIARAEALLEARRFDEAASEFHSARMAAATTAAPELAVRALSGQAWALVELGQVREAI